MKVAGARFVPLVLILGCTWLAAAFLVWRLPIAGAWLALAVAAFALLSLVVVARVVIRPLAELARRATGLASGDWASLAAPCEGVAEVEELRRALNAMAEHVRRAQAMGQAHAAAISEGQEAERGRLARELHDSTVQTLIATAQRLERAGRLIETDAQRARGMVSEARQETIATATGLREIIAGLRPPALDELGLAPALELLVRRLPDAPRVDLQVEGPVRRLAPERELAALRIVQEGLSNVSRHAQATHATVRLCYEPHGLHISVEDDGHGLPAEHSPSDLADQGHWGLIGLQERAGRFGGTVKLVSTPGQGTRLSVSLPDHDTTQPESAVVDPVCKATIQPETAYGSTRFDGQTYFFCCPVCQGAFQREPSRYAPAG